VIDLNSLSVIAGSLPPRAMGLITEWALIHQEDTDARSLLAAGEDGEAWFGEGWMSWPDQPFEKPEVFEVLRSSYTPLVQDELLKPDENDGQWVTG